VRLAGVFLPRYGVNEPAGHPPAQCASLLLFLTSGSGSWGNYGSHTTHLTSLPQSHLQRRSGRVAGADFTLFASNRTSHLALWQIGHSHPANALCGVARSIESVSNPHQGRRHSPGCVLDWLLMGKLLVFMRQQRRTATEGAHEVFAGYWASPNPRPRSLLYYGLRPRAVLMENFLQHSCSSNNWKMLMKSAHDNFPTLVLGPQPYPTGGGWDLGGLVP
jgi:hypothetical protein